jgi:hypothetical protein
VQASLSLCFISLIFRHRLNSDFYRSLYHSLLDQNRTRQKNSQKKGTYILPTHYIFIHKFHDLKPYFFHPKTLLQFIITQVNLLIGLLFLLFCMLLLHSDYCSSCFFMSFFYHVDLSSFLFSHFILLLYSMFYSSSLFLFFILLFVPYTLGCASTAHSRVFLILMHTTFILSIFMHIISILSIQQDPST